MEKKIADQLKKVEKSNVSLMRSQEKTNKKIQQLQSQLEHANEMQKTMLENQLQQQQIEFRNRVAKDLLFELSNIVELIENEKEEAVKTALTLSQTDEILDSANNEAIANLVEFSDKQIGKNVIQRVNSLKESLNMEVYGKSVIPNYTSSSDDYEVMVKNKPVHLEIPEQEPYHFKTPTSMIVLYCISSIGIVGLSLTIPLKVFSNILFWLIFTIIFVIPAVIINLKFIKAKKANHAEADMKYLQIKNDIIQNNAMIEEYQLKLSRHEYHNALKEVQAQYPSYLNKINKIKEISENFTKKWTEESN